VDHGGQSFSVPVADRTLSRAATIQLKKRVAAMLHYIRMCADMHSKYVCAVQVTIWSISAALSYTLHQTSKERAAVLLHGLRSSPNMYFGSYTTY